MRTSLVAADSTPSESVASSPTLERAGCSVGGMSSAMMNVEPTVSGCTKLLNSYSPCAFDVVDASCAPAADSRRTGRFGRRGSPASRMPLLLASFHSTRPSWMRGTKPKSNVSVFWPKSGARAVSWYAPLTSAASLSSASLPPWSARVAWNVLSGCWFAGMRIR